MFKDPNMVKYYKRFALIFLIGIIADILVDYAQLYIPQFLGEVVELFGSSAQITYLDIKDIIRNVIIVAFVLFAGRIILRFSILYASTIALESVRISSSAKSI